jgi:hypothetical protein
MSKVFRPWDVDEVWLFPASVQDFVPPGHIAHLIRETVREGLDLRAILAEYEFDAPPTVRIPLRNSDRLLVRLAFVGRPEKLTP